MKKITLFSVALMASGMIQAATPVDGWYSSGFGGYTYLPQNVSMITPVNGYFYNNTAYHNGYNFGARLGYQSNPLRYEFEYTYLTATTSSFNVNFVPQTGIYGSSSGNIFMGNIYYDFPEMLPSISPFLGVGIGYAALEVRLVSTGPSVNGGFFGASANKFAYQGTVGLTYNVAENYAANLAYRYIASQNVSEFGQVFQANLATIGVIYRFDKGSYK